jgi:hypothetical protein
VLTITVLLPSARASSDIAGAWVWPDTNTASSKLDMSPAIGGGRPSSRSRRIAISSRLRSDPGANQGNLEARVVITSMVVRRLMRNTTTRANASTATPYAASMSTDRSARDPPLAGAEASSASPS